MISFKELIEKFADVLVVEMVFDKKTMKNKIRDLEKPINKHLIKILAFKDEINFDKHINDIMTWLFGIQDMNFKKKGNKFSKELYFRLLFEEPITDYTNTKYIKTTIKQLKKHSELPRKHNDEKVLVEMFKIHKEIARLLSYNEISDIEIMLNEYK